jgi:hypothetical protein
MKLGTGGGIPTPLPPLGFALRLFCIELAPKLDYPLSPALLNEGLALDRAN